MCRLASSIAATVHVSQLPAPGPRSADSSPVRLRNRRLGPCKRLSQHRTGRSEGKSTTMSDTLSLVSNNYSVAQSTRFVQYAFDHDGAAKMGLIVGTIVDPMITLISLPTGERPRHRQLRFRSGELASEEEAVYHTLGASNPIPSRPKGDLDDNVSRYENWSGLRL